MIGAEELLAGLAKVCARAGLGSPDGLARLTGGATMESWRFACGDEPYVLRRAPSLEFMEDRPYGHDVEAALIRAAHSRGVTAPEVVAELEPADGIGSGFLMRALPGLTPAPLWSLFDLGACLTLAPLRNQTGNITRLNSDREKKRRN